MHQCFCKFKDYSTSKLLDYVSPCVRKLFSWIWNGEIATDIDKSIVILQRKQIKRLLLRYSIHNSQYDL